MSFLRLAALCAAAALFVAPQAARAQTTATAKPTIVLVHGAWADASSFDAVIEKLQAAGYTVFAPPNELHSLASDARVISTFVKTIDGPVVLVGHSYGGAVISVASVGNTNVKALVYVDAFAPDAGESPLSLLSAYPAPPKDFFVPVPFAGGADVYIAHKYYGKVFAQDVPEAKSVAMAAEQRPITGAALSEKAPASEGWKTIPSWYVVGDDDLVIPPALQIKMADRAKAHVSHTHGSHPSMIEHPEATVSAIEAAANRNGGKMSKPAIVLVHGAWADASCWNGVIVQLQAAAYAVYAPPNPLRGLASDAASIAGLLTHIGGPVVLVGHSYGGSVISVASASSDNVKALVYIGAFVPDTGESILGLLGAYPPPPPDLFTPVPLPSGDVDLYFTSKYYGPVFATGVPENLSSIMAITQRPVTAAAVNEAAPADLGWKTLPSWYVLGDLDEAIPPPLQLKMAERAKAITTRVNAGHPSMIQHPEATVAAIAAACEGVGAS